MELNSLREEKNHKKGIGYERSKRVIDCVASLVGLLLLTPIFCCIGVLIKLDSKGPVFFSQERVGKDGKRFIMYKFRSMVTDAEVLLETLKNENEMEGAMFKIKNDPRMTRLGKVLRKTSLDEFPQLWNVVKGDMSLVGPRPALVSEVNNYTEEDRIRLCIKPGCSGVWQVSGRNNVTFSEMVKMDIHYINHRSLSYDVCIVAQTIKQLFSPKGSC